MLSWWHVHCMCKHRHTYIERRTLLQTHHNPAVQAWAHCPCPPLLPGCWPHSGSTPSHGGPCVSIQQSEKQHHQWAHIIIHLTTPSTWHLLTVLLFRLTAVLLPFSLQCSAQQRAAQSGGWGLFRQQGTPTALSGKHQIWLVQGGKGEFDRKIIWPFQVPGVFRHLRILQYTSE